MLLVELVALVVALLLVVVVAVLVQEASLAPESLSLHRLVTSQQASSSRSSTISTSCSCCGRGSLLPQEALEGEGRDAAQYCWTENVTLDTCETLVRILVERQISEKD